MLSAASSRLVFPVVSGCLLAQASLGQQFGPGQLINYNSRAEVVYATDLDGDGDADVLQGVEPIGWCENLGGGVFSGASGIAGTWRAMCAADLDGDGDEDVLHGHTELMWVENLGDGSFGATRVIADLRAYDPTAELVSVAAIDLDGDGDTDVLSGGGFDRTIAWYENLGGGLFGPQRVIGGGALVWSISASDLDGDGDADVLANANYSVSWIENQGGGAFGTRGNISGGRSAHAADIDGDGDLDVFSGGNDSVSLVENLGGGVFGSQVNIGSGLGIVRSVYVIDLDLDNDADVLSASDSGVFWQRNRGGGLFGAPQLLSDATRADSVYAKDLDGDGDVDVLSASSGDGTVRWYENLIRDCNGNGVADEDDILTGVSSDCDADGVPDECQIAEMPSLDCDGNGVLDSCELGDCDGDGVLDICQIAGDASLDLNANGILDRCECVIETYCISAPNTTGQPAVIGSSGGASLSANDLTISVTNAPPFQFGLFFYGVDEDLAIFGEGALCVKPPFTRVLPVVALDGTGSVQVPVDLNGAPFSTGPNAVAPSETRRFQFWYRDPLGGPSGFNLSDGLAVTFCL